MMKYFLKMVFLSSWLISLDLSAQIGNPAPDFTVTDTDGNTHRLYEYLEAGRTIILDFYYTTCVPCQFYAPQVNLAYDKYGCNQAQTFFMAIDYNDSNAEVEAYDEEYHIQYPSVSGLDGGGNAVVNDYNIIGFPTFLVIDSTKKIVDVIDPPTLQVFDFRFGNLGIEPATCATATYNPIHKNASIHPNPFNAGNSITISIVNQNPNATWTYSLVNPIGHVIMNGDLQIEGITSYLPVPQNTPPGIYFLKILTENNRQYCTTLAIQ